METESESEDDSSQGEVGLNLQKSDTTSFAASDLFHSLGLTANATIQIRSLKNFCKQADRYSKGDDGQDIVHDFLRIPDSVPKLINILEDVKISPYKCTMVFQSLRRLLLRLSGDLSHLEEIGCNLVAGLLHKGMGSFSAQLGNRHRPQGAKAALQLLALVVALSPQSAKELAAHFNLLSEKLLPLLDMRNFKDPLDVHTCVVHFIMAFLVSGVNNVIRQICEQREILVAIISGLPLDKSSLIQPFLLSMQNQVLENPTVSKTLKVRILNEHTLQSVFKLLLWKGAKASAEKKKLKKAKHIDQAWILQEASVEEIEMVRDSAFQFLLMACASHKWGIIFHENPLQPGRNPNQTVSKLLISQKQAFEESRSRELAAQILRSCPDLMSSYLAQVKSCFEPRPSLPWTQAMQFIVRVVTLQDLEKLLLWLDSVKDNDVVLKKLLNSLGLFVVNKKKIFTALRSKEKFVRLAVTEFLIVVLTRLNSLSNIDNTFKTINMRTLFNKVLQSLPSFDDIVSIFLDEESMKSTTQQTVPGVQFSMGDYLTRVVDLLGLYTHQGVFRLGLEESDALYRLLSVIRKLEGTLTPDTTASLHLKVLKIMTIGSTAADFWINQENCNEESPLYMLFNLYLQVSDEKTIDEVKRLIARVFSPFETFTLCPLELEIWLEELHNLQLDDRNNCMQLFCRSVCSYLRRPHVYIDMVMKSNLKAMGQSVIIHRPDITFEEMLKLYEQSWSLNSDTDNSIQRTHFSPLVAAILDELALRGDAASDCQGYVQSVVLEILHQQTEPEALCRLLQEISAVLPKIMVKYALIWQTSEEGGISLQKDDDKFWKHHMSRLNEPTTTDHLMYAYVLICQSGRKNNWKQKRALAETVVHASNPSTTKEAQSLLRQVLLYLQTELQTVLMGNQINGVLILSSLVDNLLTFLCSPDNDEQVRSKAVSTLLRHPTSQTWFLTVNNSVYLPDYTEHLFKCCQLQTTLVCKYLKCANALNDDAQMISSVFEPFKRKLIKCFECTFKDMTLDACTIWENLTYGIQSCLKRLSASETALVLNLLLTTPISEFLNFTNSLKVLTQLLQHFVECDSKDATCRLDASSVEALFEAVVVTSLGIKSEFELDLYLLRFLKQKPVNSVVVSTSTLLQLLDGRVPCSLRLVQTLIQHSFIHRRALCDWLVHNHSSLVYWPLSLCLQILNIILQTNSFHDSLLSVLGKVYWRCLSTLVTGGILEEAEDPINIKVVFSALLQKNLIQDSLKGMTQLFRENLSTVPDTGYLSLLTQVFQCLGVYCPEFRVQGLTPAAFLFRLHLHWLIDLLEDPRTPSTALLPFGLHSLKLFQNLKAELLLEAAVLDSKMWFNLVTLSLKRGLRCEITGPFLTRLLSQLCRLIYGSRKLVPTALDLMQLLHGHSSFLAIMTEDDAHLPLLKEPIIDLMIVLVEMDGSCCCNSHIASLLSSYRATLVPSDQKLLYLMRAYEVNGTSMHGFRPFLWGPSAISYYSSIANTRLSLWRQPKLEDIIHLLDKEKLYQSTVHFPVEIELKPQKQVWKFKNLELRSEEVQSLYDPRFLLLVFSHFLEPGSLVDCDQFVSSGCLAYLLSSLSSMDDGLRSLGYQGLSRLFQHLEGTRNRNGTTWHFILDTLRNALRTPNVRLPSILTAFMVKASEVLFEPGDHLFTVIYQFFALKPAIDITNVPEFYTLFYSNDVHHHHHRTWLLKMLLRGLRSSMDFHLCQKRFVFQILLSYCPSPICSIQHKVLILGILRAALHIRSSALVLCKAQGLLAWFQSLIANHIPTQHEHQIVSEVVQTLQVLWTTAFQAQTSNSTKVIAQSADGNAKNNERDLDSDSGGGGEDPITNRRKLSKSSKLNNACLVSENWDASSQSSEEDLSMDCIDSGVKSKNDALSGDESRSSNSDLEMSEAIGKRKKSRASKRNSHVKRHKVVKNIEPMEKEENSTSRGEIGQSFYPFFPNQFLLTSMALLDSPRILPDLLTMHRLLSFTLECCALVPHLKPFVPYFTSCHLECLLNVATQTDTLSLPSGNSPLEIQNQDSLRRQCRNISVRIMMLVSPRVYMCTDKEKEVFDAVVIVLRDGVVDCELVPSCCHWLMDCIKSDDTQEHFKEIVTGNASFLQCAFLLLERMSHCMGEASVRKEPNDKLLCLLYSLVKLFLVLLPLKFSILTQVCKNLQNDLKDNSQDFTNQNFSKIFQLATVIQEVFLQQVDSADSGNKVLKHLLIC